MEIIVAGTLLAAFCWYQHVKANRRPITWQTYIQTMRKLKIGVR